MTTSRSGRVPSRAPYSSALRPCQRPSRAACTPAPSTAWVIESMEKPVMRRGRYSITAPSRAFFEVVSNHCAVAQSLGMGGQLVGARGHDEVVAMQAADLVGPPGHGDATPFGEQRRVMALGFGDLAHRQGKGQGLAEILEAERLFQLHDAVAV